MFAPVPKRFVTYDAPLAEDGAAYPDHVVGWPLSREWIEIARAEPEEMKEFDTEF